jgi:pyridoxal phosphate enzyme (YggS family)
MAETIAERLLAVRQGIEQAAAKAGRDPAGIRLVAVSKTKPAADVREAMAAGQLDFGENYGQELRDKLAGVSDPRVRWHFIGRLQTNKVKYVVGQVALIHSADSAKLIQEIAKRAAGMKVVQEILLEVNLAGEESKSGAAEDEVGGLIEAALLQPAVRVRGLMTMPPYFPEAEPSRPFYRRLRELRDREQARLGGRVNLSDLSMGLSHDYPVAIAEGATLLRVGAAIFGAR